MSEKLVQLKKKGGGELKETVLWTNGSPTSTQSSQTVNLSDSISNYEYIKIYWRHSTTDSTVGSSQMPVSEFSTSKIRLAGAIGSSGNSIARVVIYSTATSVSFGTAYVIGGSSSNSSVIITQVVGIS